MNSPWVKLLVFGLLFAIGGFLVGRHYGGHYGQWTCIKDASCHARATCSHGEGCTKEECKKGGSCCKGGHGEAHGEGKACCKKVHGEGHGHNHGGNHGDADVHAIIDGLKASNFQGDTTITVDGGTVNVKRTGEQMKVKVEMSDSTRVVEKTVEVR